MARDGVVRISMTEVDAAADRRRWELSVDDARAGYVQVERDGYLAWLECFVEPTLRRRGIARQAIGRVIGAQPFGDDVVLAAMVDPDDEAARAVLTATGFALAGGEGDHVMWQRSVAARPRTGPERFLTRDGRIDRFPVGDADLQQVLAHVLPRVLASGEVLTEREFNERLTALTTDVALLRRHLVDHGYVERTRSGSEYALASPVENS